MYNSMMITDVATGIATAVGIIVFVAYQVVRFNKHLKDNMQA
jgi:hypothetical protein